MTENPLHRFRMTVEYDGIPYHGWQSQKGGGGVQDAIERALARLGEEERRLMCAGRTDAGVHAMGQVIHADLTRDWPLDVLRDALNAHLRDAGEAVAILEASRAPEGFNARLSARQRHYRYRIFNRKAPSPLLAGRTWHVARLLDEAAMARAAATLLGKHDFTTYRAARCQSKSPIRTLERLTVHREGDEVIVEASARSFLHNQVRSLVGSLVQVGRGTWDETRPRLALDACDRAACGPVAPPDGLYFMRVEY